MPSQNSRFAARRLPAAIGPAAIGPHTPRRTSLLRRFVLPAFVAFLALVGPATALAEVGRPSIRGDARVGQTLSAEVEDGPEGLVYQWARLAPDNSGAEAALGPATYTVQEADIGHRLYVRVGDPATGEISDWSSGTDVVPPLTPVTEKPENTSEPRISTRSPKVGETLRGNRGRWRGTEPITYVESWLRCQSGECRSVGTGGSYTVRTEDVGARLQLQIEASNVAGSTIALSALTNAIPEPPPVPPTPVPTATTETTTDVTAATAVLHGTVNPRGQAVSYRFEYGLTTSYGAATPPTPVPAGPSAVAVQAALTGLQPGALYHARLVIVSSSGTAAGADTTFSTLVGATGGPMPALTPTVPGPGPTAPVQPPRIPPPVPAVANFTARVDANVVRLSWTASSGEGAAHVTVVRRFGRKPTAPDDGTVVYSGRGRQAVDTPVAQRRVWYAVFLTDPATTTTRPVYTSIRRFYPTLLTPYQGATVRGTVRLAWRRVKGAAYYNVQIWDGRVRRRILVRWPTARNLEVKLTAGKYRWYVYPGYGPLRAAKYGALHGQGSFTVR